MIELLDVWKDYYIDKQPFHALKGISLSFPSIQFASILGPSGCGKTTLLNLIGGLDSITRGNILVNHSSISLMSEDERNAYRNNEIGFIFQDYYLIPRLNVLDNVALALSLGNHSESESKKRALEALKRVGIENLARKKVNQLSGGQAQRVAIARSLVTDPKIILADEPTGALDSETSRSIMELLKDISRERLVIMVTHNEELAKEYSTRIIRMKDGEIVLDELQEEIEGKEIKQRQAHKSSLSLKMTGKLAGKNLASRKWKSALTVVANSFGMIGIAFFMAINHGFNVYTKNLSTATATSLPIVISAYDRKSNTEAFDSKNASVPYPSVQEIYPSVSVSTSYAYTYNNFSPKYMSYIRSLMDEGIVREYSLSYGNSYSFNLTTTFPDSLDGKEEGGLEKVKTTRTSYNYYANQAGLPYNIFHVLYGDLDQYDVIAGKLPQNENELVLVVNKYNAVSFDILKDLGFYHSTDTEEQVEDKNLSTKVKPIRFSDVLGKEYKIFTNDEMFEFDKNTITEDANGWERVIPRYKQKELTDEFYQEKGRKLTISAIIRPKMTSPFTILNPALCYLPSLQDIMVPQNANSPITQNIHNNLVFGRFGDSSTSQHEEFVEELNRVFERYSESKSKILPTAELNSIFSRYFYYYPSEDVGYVYTGFNTFFSDARSLGAELVSEELLGKDLSDQTVLEEILSQFLQDYLLDHDKAYEDIISIMAYANAYSTIQNIVVFPIDLPTRALLLDKLQEFNDIDGSPTHAATEEEQVFFSVSDANEMMEEVGDMIAMTSLILIIFAVVSVVVSASMTALLTSNNVLERKKEIGLLRSLGSRRIDVVRLFEFESIAIGFFAGAFGSLITYILCFPLNHVIDSYFPSYRVGSICNFTWYHAVLVISASIVIGVVSAIIPAIKAGRENPVDALRNE